MSFWKATNNYLDKLVSPNIRVLSKSFFAFHICGYTGLALVILLVMMLVTHLGLSLWVMAGIILTAMATFLALVMATKILTGNEQIINYHHIIAVMVISSLLLKLLNQPIFPYLDITILGVGLFTACGRVGCFMGGCCHGRPCRWGVCYQQKHAVAGFTSYLVGVRLFPIQAVESLWLLCFVAVGSALILSGHRPGEALAWYVTAHALGRFNFEFARGDAERPYYLGFSQPQWISLFLLIGLTWAELAEILLFHYWHLGAAILVILIMVSLSLRRHFQKTPKYELRHPRHLKEVAEAIQMISSPAAQVASPGAPQIVSQNIRVAHTSLGIQLSAGKIDDDAGGIRHFALSSHSGTMTEKTAEIVADMILKLKYPSGSSKLTSGNRGVFHLLIQSGDQSDRDKPERTGDRRIWLDFEKRIVNPDLAQPDWPHSIN